MKISVNNSTIKGDGEQTFSIGLNTVVFSSSAVKPLSTTTKSVDVESFSSGEKAIVEAFVNLINSK
jgi:hypothetical protein